MTFVQLTYFSMIAQKLSFTKAAQACYTSQPNLSRQIRALEKEVGARLVVRSHEGIELTDAGKIFAAFCNAAIAEHEQMIKMIQSLGSKQKLRFGGISGISVLDTAIEKWALKNIDFDISVVHQDLERPTKDNGLDMGIVISNEDANNPQMISIFKYQMPLLVPKIIAKTIDTSKVTELQRYNLSVTKASEAVIEEQLAKKHLSWNIKSYDSLFNYDVYLSNALLNNCIALKVNDDLGHHENDFITVDNDELLFELPFGVAWNKGGEAVYRPLAEDLKGIIHKIDN